MTKRSRAVARRGTEVGGAVGRETITRSGTRAALLCVLVLGAASLASAATATRGSAAVRNGAANDGAAAVRNDCSGCHRETSPGHFDRISDIRKTPEGWAMTLFRMHQVHGLALDPAERDRVLRYLSDVGGLAPEEAAAGRFALERRPDAQDLKLDDDMQAMCGRCHSLARVALQRRDADEWLKLAHTHVGQWPSLEYQEGGRDRFWWQSATTEYPKKLAALFPLDTPAWRAWSRHPHPNLAGRWIVFGHTPGHGDYHGIAVITKKGADEYTATYTLTYADGAKFDGTSKSVVYTGYEWRGSATLGGADVREVFAAAEDGSEIKGRWFQTEHSESGGNWTATRVEGAPKIIAVSPRAARVGTSQQVALIGRGLQGDVNFGAGTHTTVVSRAPDALIVNVTVDGDASQGLRDVTVGKLKASGGAAIYRSIDRITVEPAFAIARLGGGRIAPVTAQFEAVGYLDSPAGGGPISLGALPATWTVAPHDAQAERAQDVKFAGSIDQTGRFLPAGAGPNPAREFSGNNVGDLSVVATVKDAAHDVQAKSHLVVTVQRWNTPPIY
ncbi:MAG TPA: quinohemoprotein amine dehydrogenase subunit alpha [Steroidobacteraceae bacterium]|nr:quinohemoprotein amine dehydrogenase subunit alpha [Steroidobacteraceae bacterium]